MCILFCYAMLGDNGEKPQEADVLLKYLIEYKALVRTTGKGNHKIIKDENK